MFTGQVAVVSNRETWVSDLYQIVDEDTGEVLNLLNPDIGFDCSLYIGDDDCRYSKVFPLGGGKVVIGEDDEGPGVQWVIDMKSDAGLYAGTYRCGLKTVANGITTDLIIGTIAVVEGNR